MSTKTTQSTPLEPGQKLTATHVNETLSMGALAHLGVGGGTRTTGGQFAIHRRRRVQAVVYRSAFNFVRTGASTFDIEEGLIEGIITGNTSWGVSPRTSFDCATFTGGTQIIYAKYTPSTNTRETLSTMFAGSTFFSGGEALYSDGNRYFPLWIVNYDNTTKRITSAMDYRHCCNYRATIATNTTNNHTHIGS